MGKKKAAPVPIPVGAPAKPYTTPEIYAGTPKWQVETDHSTGEALIVSRGTVFGRFADHGDAEEFVEAMLLKDAADDIEADLSDIADTADGIKDSIESAQCDLNALMSSVKEMLEDINSLLEKLP